MGAGDEGMQKKEAGTESFKRKSNSKGKKTGTRHCSEKRSEGGKAEATSDWNSQDYLLKSVYYEYI